MRKEILDLKPIRYLCPFCGEWHEFDSSPLKEYTHYDPLEIKCDNFDEDSYAELYVEGISLYYKINNICWKENGNNIDGGILIPEIISQKNKPRITFKSPHIANSKSGTYLCGQCCSCSEHCNLAKLADESSDNRTVEVTLGFEFEEKEYFKIVNPEKFSPKKEKSINNKEKTIKKGNTIMANNCLNLNMEFGLSTDENISSTLMGIAVRTNGSWRIYDKKENAITDIGDLQLGNLPLFIMPKTKLEIGDLIKSDEGYYYVKKLENGVALTLSASTGELKQVVPVKNLFGFSCYSKVCSLCEELDIGEEMDIETLAIMSTIFGNYGENNGTMNQFLPFMFMKDGFKEGFNLKKLFIISMLTSSQKDQQNPAMQQLLPLFILKEKGEDKNGLLKLFALSTILGGAKSNDPMTQIFMMTALEDEKGADDFEDIMLCSMLSQNANAQGNNNDYDDEEEEIDDLPF